MSGPSRSLPANLMYALPIRKLRDVLRQILPDDGFVSTAEVPSYSLARVYIMNLESGRQLSLKWAPTLAIRLLRQEHDMMLSEAAFLSFVSDMFDNGAAVVVEHGNESASLSSVPLPVIPTDADLDRDGDSLMSKHEEVLDEPIASHQTSLLARVLPRIIKHSHKGKEIYITYTITSFVEGSPLSSFSIYLSNPERHIIERQIGSLVRSLALLTSPNGAFGGIYKVCGVPSIQGAADFNSTKPSTEYNSDPSKPPGSPSWPLAFLSLTEAILRDGEDMSVLLPYDEIRLQLSRHADKLSAVTVPRLLVVDIANEANVLIERDPDPEYTGINVVPNLDTTRLDATGTEKESVRITGIRDWSQGFFGDPLLCDCFDSPSDAFLQGWNRPPALLTDSSNQGYSSIDGDGTEDLIEDLSSAPTRMLMYRCYHALVAIITEYYRPSPQSSRKELEGRRKLTKALAELGGVSNESSTVEEALARVRAGTASVATDVSRMLENGDANTKTCHVVAISDVTEQIDRDEEAAKNEASEGLDTTTSKRHRSLSLSAEEGENRFAEEKALKKQKLS